jgi:predicted ATPase
MERLGPVVVLAGPNGAGKSRIFDAVEQWSKRKLPRNDEQAKQSALERLRENLQIAAQRGGRPEDMLSAGDRRSLIWKKNFGRSQRNRQIKTHQRGQIISDSSNSLLTLSRRDRGKF